MKAIRNVCIIIACEILLFIVNPLCAFGENNQDVDVENIIEDIISYELDESDAETVQDFIDTQLCESAGIDAEWYIIALSQYGDYNFERYEAALLEYIESNEISSAVTREKYALALIAAGSRDDAIQELLDDSIGQQGIMSWIFGLHILNNGYESEKYGKKETVDNILTLQCDDGGWAVIGEKGDVDVTAMSIQALSVYYSTNSDVKESIDKAMGFLKKQQQENGTFLSMGASNCESTSQVLIAISSLDDITNSNEFSKENRELILEGVETFRSDNGMFSHTENDEYNKNSTIQALCGFVSYIRCNEGKSSLYRFDNLNLSCVETNLNTKNSEKSNSCNDLKMYAVIVTSCCYVVMLLLLKWRKKLNVKNFLASIFAVAAVIVLALKIDIKSEDEYFDSKRRNKENIIGNVSIEIRCDTIKNDIISKHIPSDGVILSEVQYDIAEDDSALDILIEVSKNYHILVDADSSGYVYGIENIYEKEYGDLSGWVYHINGISSSVGANNCILKPGDKIEWLYTKSLGKDLNEVYEQ